MNQCPACRSSLVVETTMHEGARCEACGWTGPLSQTTPTGDPR